MASTAAPYGLKPVNLIGGQPYAGSTRQIKIASGYDTNIFNGSIVSIVAAGTLEIVTTVGSNSSVFPAGTVGVFVGCSYTDPNSKQKVFAQYFPADTVASVLIPIVLPVVPLATAKPASVHVNTGKLAVQFTVCVSV